MLAEVNLPYLKWAGVLTPAHFSEEDILNLSHQYFKLKKGLPSLADLFCAFNLVH
jgi:hypothetical protein